MATNEFVLDEALVNQSFKKAVELLLEKQQRKEKLTLLEFALTKFIRLNFCLAELMGPLDANTPVKETLITHQKLVEQFPEFQRVFAAISMMRNYHENRDMPFTDVEDAFIRYLNLATEAGCKMAEKLPNDSNLT